MSFSTQPVFVNTHASTRFYAPLDLDQSVKPWNTCSLDPHWISQSRRLLPWTSKKWNTERSRASVFIQAAQFTDITPELVGFPCVRSLSFSLKHKPVWAYRTYQRTGFIKSLERFTDLHVKECAQVPTPWTKSALLVSSTEESWSGGMGGARRGEASRAAQRRAAHTAEQRHAHLAARPRRGIPARSAFCLNSDLHDLFLRETLHVSLFAPQWVWWHIICMIIPYLIIALLWIYILLSSSVKKKKQKQKNNNIIIIVIKSKRKGLQASVLCWQTLPQGQCWDQIKQAGYKNPF